MNDFTSKQFSDLIYDILSIIKDDGTNNTETTLEMPTTESVFPCRVICIPNESILKSRDSLPILKDFQITIEHWSDKQRQCMDMSDKTDTGLRQYNILRTNTQQLLQDNITQKYRLITIYEVHYNAITNSFEPIK